MSKAGGLVLILGGLAVAAYVMPSDDDASAPEAVRQVDVAQVGAKSARVDERPSQDIAVPRPQPAFRPIAPTAARAAEPVPAFSAPVVVTIAPRSSEPAAAAPGRAAAVPKDRDSLARELQKELRRVGCYDGELNGAWTPATRRAMKAFTDRVNATLPVEEPDAVLFVMVQSQQDRVCGKPCPVGQGISEDGRCLPNAILAKTLKKPSPPSVTAQLPIASPPPGEKSAPAITGWSTTITATARAPVVAATPPATPRVIAATPPLAPPPTEGRMALAGPPKEAMPPDAALPFNAVPPATVAPRPQALQAPPKRVVEGGGGGGWTRSMNARRFDSPN